MNSQNASFFLGGNQLKNFLLITGVGTLFLTIIIGIVYFQTSSNQEDHKVQELNTLTKNALVSNFDYSSRVEEGASYFNQPKFEEDLKASLKTSFKSSSKITFSYLKDVNENTKGVRVVVEEGKSKYQTTYLTNVHEGG